MGRTEQMFLQKVEGRVESDEEREGVGEEWK